MTPRTRRIIAYIAGRLISGRHAESIVDVDAGETIGFQGEVRPDHVAALNIEEGSVVAGQSDGRALFLSDSHTGVDLKLIIEENRFYGWDLSVDKAYYGKVVDNEVRLRVHGEPGRYVFLV